MKKYTPGSNIIKITPGVISFLLWYLFRKIYWIIVCLILISTQFVMADEDIKNTADTNNLIIKAKIGIQRHSGNQALSSVRTRELLQTGDLIRIYIHMEKSGFIYVVHSEGKYANLLNSTEQKIHSSSLVLPSVQAWYEVDGQNDIEQISIICAPDPHPSLSAMESKPLDIKNWHILETKLKESSRLLDSDESLNTFTIAGNVRGLPTRESLTPSAKNQDTFIRNLPVSSGCGLVIKTYTFKVR